MIRINVIHLYDKMKIFCCLGNQNLFVDFWFPTIQTSSQSQRNPPGCDQQPCPMHLSPLPKWPNCLLPSLSNLVTRLWISAGPPVKVCDRVSQSVVGPWECLGPLSELGCKSPDAAKATIKNPAGGASEQRGALMICLGSKSFYNFILPSQWPQIKMNSERSPWQQQRRKQPSRAFTLCPSSCFNRRQVWPLWHPVCYRLSGSWRITETTFGRKCGPITQRL